MCSIDPSRSIATIRRRIVAASLVCLSFALTSCHGRKPDDAPTPDRTDDGVYELASHVSKQADAVLVIRDVEEFMAHLERQRAFDLLGTDAPAEAVGRILSGSMGFDPRDVRAWRSKGIRTDAPLMLAFSEDDPVLVIPVADVEQFNGYMEGQAWAYENPRRRQYRRYGTRRVDSSTNVPEKGPRLWQVHDGVACIAIDGRLRDLERTCVSPGPLASPGMSDFDPFLAFRDGPMRDADIGLFVPTYNTATVEAFVDEFSREDVVALDVAMRAFAETSGFSMTGTVDGDALEAHARIGLTREGHAAFSELFDVSSVVEMEGVTPPNAVAALRCAVSPDTAWTWLRTALHWEARQGMRSRISEIEELLGREFDVHAEVVDQLAGELVMVVEPIPMTSSSGPGSQRRPHHHRHTLTEDGMAFSFIVPFRDPVAPPKLLELLEEIDAAANSGSGKAPRVVVRDGTEGDTKIAEFKSQYAPRIFVRGKHMILAPSVLPVEHVQKMLTRVHPDPKSRSARRFAEAPGVASGFFDFQAFFDALGRARAVDELGDLARQLQFAEASIRLEPSALVADGRVVDLSFIRIITSLVLGREVRQWTSTPKRRLLEFARTASRYYSRYQRSCTNPSNCREPWHADPDDAVGDSERVFPGGVDQRLVSHAAPPVAGQRVDGDIQARRFTEETAALLGFHDRGSSRFQYIYETNGKTGAGAEFTIRAVADLDPTTPEKHTLIVTGVAGRGGRVDISKVRERNRFQ
jgi:hypothetical protein